VDFRFVFRLSAQENAPVAHFIVSKNRKFQEFLISKPEKAADPFRWLLSPFPWRTFWNGLTN
jgi:hypothetical protein